MVKWYLTSFFSYYEKPIFFTQNFPICKWNIFYVQGKTLPERRAKTTKNPQKFCWETREISCAAKRQNIASLDETNWVREIDFAISGEKKEICIIQTCKSLINNTKMGKSGGIDASSAKLNPTFHCCTVPWLRDAGSPVAVHICASTVQCRVTKTGQQKVQLSSKTKHFAHLGI